MPTPLFSCSSPGLPASEPIPLIPVEKEVRAPTLVPATLPISRSPMSYTAQPPHSAGQPDLPDTACNSKPVSSDEPTSYVSGTALIVPLKRPQSNLGDDRRCLTDSALAADQSDGESARNPYRPPVRDHVMSAPSSNSDTLRQAKMRRHGPPHPAPVTIEQSSSVIITPANASQNL